MEKLIRGRALAEDRWLRPETLDAAQLPAGAAVLAVRRPSLVAKLAAAGAGAGGVLAAVGAAGVRKVARAIEPLHAADAQLAAQATDSAA